MNMKNAASCFSLLALSLLLLAGCGNKKSGSTSADTTGVAKESDKGTVRIGNQEWMTENLNVGTFRNGDPIPEAKTAEEWIKAAEEGTAAWCYYNNDSANGAKYGRLYNWYAVNDPRGLAPAGWRIPSKEDWSALVAGLGGDAVAGAAMKTTTGWNDERSTNTSGFSALPGGFRLEDGEFAEGGAGGWFWGSTADATGAWTESLGSRSASFGGSTQAKAGGNSVRCIKD